MSVLLYVERTRKADFQLPFPASCSYFQTEKNVAGSSERGGKKADATCCVLNRTSHPLCTLFFHATRSHYTCCFPPGRCVVVLCVGARSARCGGGPPHRHRSRSGRERTVGIHHLGQRGGRNIQSHPARQRGRHRVEQSE